jgi:hypothetical protein
MMTQSDPQEIRPEMTLPAKAVVAKPTPMEMDNRGLYVIKNQGDEFRVAKMLMDSGAVNSSLKTPAQVMVAMQAARSVGLNPYTALRQMAFISGSLCFYGDLELAVVRMTGELESIEEFTFLLNEDGKYERRSFENSNLHLPAFGAVCRIKRKGLPIVEESFTEADAKTSGLWGKTPTWRSFPARMMGMRARGMAIRNSFSDATQGIATKEYDYEGIDR